VESKVVHSYGGFFILPSFVGWSGQRASLTSFLFCSVLLAGKGRLASMMNDDMGSGMGNQDGKGGV
jgi:hypothetical protein